MNKKPNYQITTERIDDIVLLLSVMKQMKLSELIDEYLPRHPNQQGLDWGWVATIWLSYILSQGDHRQVTVKVVSGEQADDGWYIPIFEEVSQNLEQPELLWVGDCKMSSQKTRSYIHQQQNYYLTPLSRVGQVTELIKQWVNQALGGVTPGEEIIRVDSEGQSHQIATAYELSRLQQMTLLSLHQAVLTYRDEWLVERCFSRLKVAPLSITPFFVQRDDQVKGLVHLLSLAVRLLSLIEFVMRRSLKQTGKSLKGLYPANPTKATTRPTTEKLLQAFDNLTLTLIQAGEEWYGDVTSLREF